MMASQLCSSEHIFVPGSTVQVLTAHLETIVGEVFVFDYESRVLILKSKASNGNSKASNFTILNLSFCSEIKTLSGGDDAGTPVVNGVVTSSTTTDPSQSAVNGSTAGSTPAAAAVIASNVKLPDIDFKKLENRLENAIEERNALERSFKSGAGIDGVLLYHQLNKTFGDNVKWDGDSIIVRNNVTISAPYRTDCVTLRNPKEKLSDDSVNYIKAMVEKFWRSHVSVDRESSGGASGGNSNGHATSGNNLKLTHSNTPKTYAKQIAGDGPISNNNNNRATTTTRPG